MVNNLCNSVFVGGVNAVYNDNHTDEKIKIYRVFWILANNNVFEHYPNSNNNISVVHSGLDEYDFVNLFNFDNGLDDNFCR